MRRCVEVEPVVDSAQLYVPADLLAGKGPSWAGHNHEDTLLVLQGIEPDASDFLCCPVTRMPRRMMRYGGFIKRLQETGS